jgi:glycosyltransferase involved in cell wall biosynthesis
MIDNSVTDFSFIVTTRNNRDEFSRTFNSILIEAPDNSEIVVVDGSDIPLGLENVEKLVPNNSLRVKYILDNKKGVYNAMNLGIESSKGDWIVIMTAGDFLELNAKQMLKSILNCNYKVVVFSQRVLNKFDGDNFLIHKPNMSTIWPHQSVIIHKEIHKKEGLYDLGYKYLSEQYLFFPVRRGDVHLNQ